MILFGRRPPITVAWGNAPGLAPRAYIFWSKAIFTRRRGYDEDGLRPNDSSRPCCATGAQNRFRLNSAVSDLLAAPGRRGRAGQVTNAPFGGFAPGAHERFAGAADYLGPKQKADFERRKPAPRRRRSKAGREDGTHRACANGVHAAQRPPAARAQPRLERASRIRPNAPPVRCAE